MHPMTQIHFIKSLVPRFCAAVAMVAAVYATPLRAEPGHPPIHEHGVVGSDTPAGAHAAAQVGDSPQSSVRYTCPMHPEVVSDTAGRCPHCGMKLVEQEEGPSFGDSHGA
jgi:hypothetical protein